MDYGFVFAKQRETFDEKVAFSKRIIENFLAENDGYVAFSGGLDSTVLLDLVRKVDPTVPAVLCDTSMLEKKVRDFAYRVIGGGGQGTEDYSWGWKRIDYENGDTVIFPQKTFGEIIQEFGWPVVSKEVANNVERARKHIDEEDYDMPEGMSMKMRQFWMRKNAKEVWDIGKDYYIPSRWRPLLLAPFKVSARCCYWLKKAPFREFETITGKRGLVGIKASDSRMRERAIAKDCEQDRFSRPMGFWDDNDIWEYVQRFLKKSEDAFGGGVLKKDKETGEWPAAWAKEFYGEFAKPDQSDGRRSRRSGCVGCLFGVQYRTSEHWVAKWIE